MEEKYKKGNEKADQRKFASSQLKKIHLKLLPQTKKFKKVEDSSKKAFYRIFSGSQTNCLLYYIEASLLSLITLPRYLDNHENFSGILEISCKG